ncbi:hypothetical membrane protein [Pelotomaculum thermopropionicum SI]|uniref:Hypothetical membrane protein n=1 Tax=Pelotomaculum thermopropionicum (strain DSM 13744 / JCM 10971 / SI) TaxID=370438 RepID=A5D4I4_PELTS|nr:hypothetical membrane protein [Pelotomaculum thermopropionicum SI]
MLGQMEAKKILWKIGLFRDFLAGAAVCLLKICGESNLP